MPGQTDQTPPSTAMRILLADDHAMIRAGLCLLLTRVFAGAQIVEADDYRQALQAVIDGEAFTLILVDRNMPYGDHGTSLRSLCERAAKTPVIVLSASEDPAHIREAIACGARGYLTKNTHESVLFSALQLVLCGGTYLPVALMEDAADDLVGDSPHDTTLTPRQLEILAELTRGKTNKEIARAFHISPATVRTHINAIFRALSVSNRTQAVHVAGKLGLNSLSGK